MASAALTRYASSGVTLLGDTGRPCGVTLAFTERTGGVSSGAYASLNLGDNCGDEPRPVAENRARALAAIGAGQAAAALVNPVQVHGDRIIVIAKGHLTAEEGAAAAREGADGVVCAEPGVPVLLCAADCVLVILTAAAPDGRRAFAVVHSGWRGTMARISGRALEALCEVCGCEDRDVYAYVGPHIGPRDFEVSAELARDFRRSFGAAVTPDARHVDLGEAVRITLAECGVAASHIVCVDESVYSCPTRFFSYRASGGVCGRHGALAYMERDLAGGSR